MIRFLRRHFWARFCLALIIVPFVALWLALQTFFRTIKEAFEDLLWGIW